MTNKSFADSGKTLLLYQARLDGSISPQDVDRLVPATLAANALLTAFRGTTGNRLPQRVIAYISTHVHKACRGIVAGDLAGLEILSTYHGCISLRGVALPSESAGLLRFVNVSHTGMVNINDSFPSAYVDSRIKQAIQNVREGSMTNE